METDTRILERSKGKRLWPQREISELTIKKVTEFRVMTSSRRNC